MTKGKRQKQRLTVRIQDKEAEAMGDEDGHPLKQRIRGREEDGMTESYSKGGRDNDRETHIRLHREKTGN